MKYKYKSAFASDMENMVVFKVSLGHSPVSYEAGLRRLDTFLCRYYPGSEMLSQEIVSAWCGYENKDNKSPNHAIVIREFAKYLVSAGKEAYVLPEGFSKKYTPELPYIFTGEELRNFFAAADRYPHRDNSPLLEYIVPTVFRLQFACGLRPKEILRIRRADMDYRHRKIYIRESKGHKDRILPVNDDIIRLVSRYDVLLRTVYPDCVYLFPSPRGDAYRGGWLWNTFRKCWEMSGNKCGGRMPNPYALRHNYATYTLMKWIEEEKDLDVFIPYLSAYMGHESFSSTFYYIHLLPERLSKLKYMDAGKIIGGNI